jgi:reductive dehalogenase
MQIFSNKNRAQHLGPFQLEKLERDPAAKINSASLPLDPNPADADSIATAAQPYLDLCHALLEGPMAHEVAPVPDDLLKRAENLKASAYFLDAALVGCCTLADSDWLSTADLLHTHAVLLMVEFGRQPGLGEPGCAWIRGTNDLRSNIRAAEIAGVLAGYIRALGFSATGHVTGVSKVDLSVLATRAGLAVADETGLLRAPFLQRGFALGAITTEYQFATDLPLASMAALNPSDPDIYMGVGGTRPGWQSAEEERRPMHLGRYPMENIRKVDGPSTLVIAEQIRRVPKRGDFFTRAEAGDLGGKAKQESPRFPFKHPLAAAMAPMMVQMIPMQGTREKLTPTGVGGNLADPRTNAQAIKALGYYLGVDFVGICRAEPWMYYSHDNDTSVIDPYHEFAVVMLIDQGYDTMSGASGDDWISASQSMRAYLRGAEISGIMAAHCRRMGYSSRTHTNANSDIVHNPAILMAGLAEVSRIGDTLLNPFIGPRSKSVIFTTDLPMEVDKPIDFGLQDFCSQCKKCARECPCNAITYGPKVMFNGYEIWKADVDKCTKYRVTQSRGSACGRCMKMCPWNREDTVEGRRLAQLSIDFPESRAAIIKMDDALQNGTRNLIKRWWFDLEIIDGVAVRPPGGTNERDLILDQDYRLGRNQKLAMFPPALQPPPSTTMNDMVPVDRPAGIRAYLAAQRPEDARLDVIKPSNPSA